MSEELNQRAKGKGERESVRLSCPLPLTLSPLPELFTYPSLMTHFLLK
jgi:hypothetical protein